MPSYHPTSRCAQDRSSQHRIKRSRQVSSCTYILILIERQHLRRWRSVHYARAFGLVNRNRPLALSSGVHQNKLLTEGSLPWMLASLTTGMSHHTSFTLMSIIHLKAYLHVMLTWLGFAVHCLGELSDMQHCIGTHRSAWQRAAARR